MTDNPKIPLSIILRDTEDRRLDSTLSKLLPGVSRKRIKAAFRDGRIMADGKAAKGSDIALPGMKIELKDLPGWGEASSHTHPGEAVPDIEIVYQDDSLIIAEKPPGVPSYPKQPGESYNVSEAILGLFPDIFAVGDQPNAPGLCHRLDLETSGLLLFARTSSAFDAIREQFRRRSIGKIYLAAVQGIVPNEGSIEVAIGRRSSKKMQAEPPPTLRQWPARTDYKLETKGKDKSLVRLSLVTGVTHQARAHMAWLGHPILGDVKYGGPKADRLGLHAWKISLEHPVSAKKMEIQSSHHADIYDMVTSCPI